MQPDPEDLANLADSVLEGRPLDWQELESSAGAETRGLISQFRTIARIAEIRRRVANDPPEWWGHLKIEERLGAGAFGEVFRAWDSRLEREVALKLLSSDCDPAVVLREARLLARIRHPNIVTVFDAAEFEGRAGFWMEFIQGHSLEEGVRDRGPLPAPEVLKLAIELCGALDAVHAAGLLHRDIKAQNVVRTADGRVVLMDFGAGDELASVEPVSQQSVGTPLYLAPEILFGSAATTKSEIYSLAGRNVFQTITTMIICFRDTGHRRSGGQIGNRVRTGQCPDSHMRGGLTVSESYNKGGNVSATHAGSHKNSAISSGK